jgi:carbon-monoxide dehydrogenase medium subunit
MEQFDFITVTKLEDALCILADKSRHTRIVAGATNVMNNIRSGKINQAELLNINDIKSLNGIEFTDGKIRIGSLTTIAQIAGSSIIKEHAPVLFAAAKVFADPLTRNRATIGGNIADASPAADTAPALLALDARVQARSAKEIRSIPISEFFKGVNKTELRPDEIITAVEFEPNPCGAFEKVGLRKAMAISVVSVAVTLTKDADGTVSSCRIAFGSVAPKPVRAYNAETVLTGNKPSDTLFEMASEAVKLDICPIDDVRATKEYRLSVAGNILQRIFERAYNMIG